MARKFLWVVVSLVVVVTMIWSAGWYFVSQTLAAAISKPDRSFGGMAANCSGPAVAGFPFRFDIDCSAFSVTDASRGLTLNVPGVKASALLYRPGRVTASALGPVKLDAGIMHLTANAGWTTAAARADLGLSGLSGFATTLETGRLVLESTSGPFLPIHVVEFKRGEIELAPSAKAPDSMSLIGTLAALHIERPNGKNLPEVTAAIDATAVDCGASVGMDTALQLANWIDKGGKLQIDRLELISGGTALRVQGNLSVAKSGLLSGKLSVRMFGLNSLQDLAEAMVPGTGDQVVKLVGAIKQLTRSVSTPDGQAQEIELTIRNGDVSYGVIPIMYPDGGKIVRLSIPPLFNRRN